MTNEQTKPGESSAGTNANKIKVKYRELLDESAALYPRVDQKLLLDILNLKPHTRTGKEALCLRSYIQLTGLI